MSRAVNVTDLLHELMAHIGINVGAEDAMSVILNKLKVYSMIW